MWIDISPLRKNKNYRNLFLGQFVSFVGTMLSLVALPYQVYQITDSTLAVGLLGIVELVPLLLTAFIGGALADSMDRRKLLLWSEFGMGFGCLLLVFNALLPEPQVWLLFIIAGFMSALTGFHRPALEAMTPRLVAPDQIQSVSVLSSLKYNVSAIGGPALAGLCISRFGMPWTYAIDFITFLFSLIALSRIDSMGSVEQADPPSFKSVLEAIRYAIGRPELLGTYLVDMVAMIFGMPNALFPAIAETMGGAKMVGLLYSAPAAGALVITVFSGWTKKINRHGAGVVYSAMLWGIAIIGFGLTNQWILVILFLMLAGAADCMSGIFRTTIWNQTIPDRIRGRMAGLEMISYMTGPLLGNAEAGLIASMTNTQVSIISGGVLCILGVILCVFLLPGFWKYRSHLIPIQADPNLDTSITSLKTE